MHKPYNELHDEILERLWELQEENNSTVEALCDKCEEKKLLNDALKDLKSENLIKLNGDQIEFTEQGKEKASLIIRRHRITDVLLYHILNMKDHDEREKIACQTEHTLLPEMVDGICTLLGHPSVSPDGKKIPPGACCINASKNKEDTIFRLKEVSPGKKYRIVYIKPKNHNRFKRLMALGLLPGTEFYLLQKFPAYVIKTNFSELAFEENVAEDIFVTDVIDVNENLQNFAYKERGNRGRRKHRNWFIRHFGTSRKSFED